MIEIELKNIKKNYGLKNVLDGINFEAKTGERIAIVGSNGAGKSTILNIISGEENQDSGKLNIKKDATIGKLNQIYQKEKEDLLVKEFLERKFEDINSLEKEMKKLEKEMTIETNEIRLEKIINKYGKLQEQFILIGGYEMQEDYNKICSGFRFDDDILNKKYNLLSGGEKTIVNLAGILLSKPSILLLDEPTNHLDIETLEWLEEFLISYKGTILMVSHDRYFLDKVATKTILIENGKEKIYYGNYTYFLEEDERRTLAQFEKYKSQQKQIKKMKESIKTLRKFGELAKNELFFKRAKSIEKRLEKIQVIDRGRLDKKGERQKGFKLEINMQERSGKDVIEIRNLSKSFGDKILFENLNLDIMFKEKVCLIGKNGTGKSTLIKMILNQASNLNNNFSERIRIGSSVKIGYIPQEIIFDNQEETILEFFLKTYKGGETLARTILAKFMFRGEDVFKKVGKLSGGEKVRLVLLKLIQEDVNFLILDEPTNHIDIETREILEEAIKNYKGTVLFISHDRYFINALATRIIEIRDRIAKTYIGNYDNYQKIQKQKKDEN